MQIVDISKDLKNAILAMESLINGQDGEKILEKIKKYKEQKQSS